MNKSRNFFIAAAIAIIMLFILGNWATSAQATGSTFIDAIPTSMAMPTEFPVTPPGDVPSVEEQDELKAIAQAYTEIRYRALSASASEDFKQNGFGDIVSDMHDAGVFLREEKAKLAVQIKHAELNHLRYANYKFFLAFRSITVDPATQTATMSVVEGNEVVYEISEELSPDNPIVSHTGGIEHTIVLRKKHDQWRIVSDTYDDDLWKMLRASGNSTDEILRGADNLLHTMKPTLETTNTATVAKLHDPLPPDPSSHPYDRAVAVAYALKYWGVQYGDPDLSNKSGYNPYYDAFNPNDCQNFVSQALYEGGNVSMFIPSPLPGPSTDGQSGWYSLYDKLQHASAWNEVNSFYTFAKVDSRLEPVPGYEYYGEGPVGIDITVSPGSSQVPDELEIGDVIQYDWGKDGFWNHTAIVVDIEDNGMSRIPYVAAHTTNYDRVPYTLYTSQTDTNYRFIHIERSNGYPPVKASIEQEPGDQAGKSSNDAGTNPQNSCTFSLNDPEVYFGLCPDGNSSSSGFRFKNIPIPQGAVIKYAYLTFTVDGPYSSPLDIKIYGENAPDSAPFTDTSQPKDRSLVGPIVWPITDTWQIGQRRTTPNLSPIMNVIVGNGWLYGNSLSFIFKDPGPNTGLRRVVTFDRASWDIQYGPLFPAKLIAAYTMDGSGSTAPTVYSVTRKTSSPTNAATVEFEVKFSEPVIGVDTTWPFIDFSPLHTEGVADASITAVSGSGDTYTVTVNTGNGDGKIRLDVFAPDWLDPDPIRSVASGSLLDSGFYTGESYTIDKTAPFAIFIGILPPSTNPTNAANVDFWVYFNEPVVGVDTATPTFDDFSLQTGGVSGASITSVTRVRGDQYHVIVNTGSGNGTISLKLENSGGIKDYATNPLHVFGSSTSDLITINKDAPTANSSLPDTTSPTDAASVNFTVTFSESVTGVDASDFALTATGVTGAAITNVSGSGDTYIVNVNTGSGDGTIRLDIVDDDSIVDADGNPLGIPGAGNGNFSAGGVCNVVKTAPIVTGIVRSSLDHTSYYSVKYTVTFSKSVTGVDLSDFVLTTSGVSDAAISGISGSGQTYTVTVNTGTGSGTIRLDVVDDDSILGAIPLGGTGVGNGNFNSGETYTIDKTAISSIVSKSADTDDGLCNLSDCSLREALATASPGDTITFDTALSSGATIHLNTTITLARNITIDGSALAVPVTLSGDVLNTDKGLDVLMVNSGVIANLNNLTIANGKYSGIYNRGILTVTHCTITGNHSVGIDNNGGNLTIINSIITNNSSVNGAGIYNHSGTLTITSSTISGNSAGEAGGGLYNKDTATVTNSTFAGNTGGGIYNRSGTLTLINDTFSDNSASSSGYGGGVYNNYGATLNYTNTIIANSVNSQDCVNSYGGIIGTNLNNLVKDGTCSASLSGNPNLGALADNGGPTQTMALLAGSPAVDAGDDAACAASPVNNTDQRGVTRPFGAHCDIGAYELELASVNAPPTDITLSASSVDENQPIGTLIGTLSSVDPDAGDTHTYSFCGGTDDASFQISADQLQTNAVFDFETKNGYSVCLRTTDSGDLTFDKNFTVSVTNVNDPPVITSDSNLNSSENTATVTTVTATDPDANTTLTYSLVGGADAARFTINPSTGVLAFLSPPDFESPADAGADNVYDVSVQVSDGALTDTQAIAVTVTNANEAPTNISLSNASLTENLPIGATVGTLSTTDPDAGDAHTYSFCGGPDDASFSLNGSLLQNAAVFDFETKNTYSICLRAADSGGLTFDKNFIVSVTDVPGLELLTPANAEVLHYNRPTFDWDDFPGAPGYRLQVSRNSAFTRVILNVATNGETNSAYTPTSNLPANTTLYWRVRAMLAGAPWSEIRTLTTANPPGRPTLSSPANNALVDGPSPLLDWLDATVPNGVTFDHYQIQIATDANFTAIAHDANVSGINNSQDGTAILPFGSTYYWRVRSFNTAGDYSIWSAVRSLKIKFAAPALLLPGNGATVNGRKPVFTWNPVSGAANYTIQISRNTVFSPLALQANIATPTYTPASNLLAGTTYYWRVRVKGTYGPSNWSVVFTFTTPP